MDHLFLLCLSFIFFGVWYTKPGWKIALFPAILSLGASSWLGYTAADQHTDGLMHIGIDMVILSGHLFLLQIFKHLKWSILLILPLSLTLFLAHPTASTQELTNSQDHPEILIKFDSEAHAQTLLKIHASSIDNYELAFDPQDKEASDLEEYFLIDLKENIDPYKFIKKLSQHDHVDWVEENQRVEIPEFIISESTHKTSVKNFNDPYVSAQWHIKSFNLSAMHDKLEKLKIKQKKEVVIAILDTGIDSKHEDLQAVYKSCGIRKNDSDTKGHGTHCAGIAAAVSNNKKGVASILPSSSKIKVMSIQVLNKYGFGTQESIIDGIIQAADLKVDVISLSLGGATSEKKERAYREAVKYANKKGAIVVVAAGNSSRNAKNYSPANTKGVISVAAIDSTMRIASFSNTVEDLEMGIAAPGVDILSTFPNNQYKQFNGTSMATPFVAGMIGLLKAYYPDITTKEAYEKITSGSISASNNKTPIMLPNQIVDQF